MEPAVRVLVAPSEDARPSLASPAEGARTPRRALDLRDMLDELPSLAALKDKKWMKLLPSLPRRPGRARQSPSASPTASTAGSDSMELSPVWLPTPKVRTPPVAKSGSRTEVWRLTVALPADGDGDVSPRAREQR